MHGDFSRLRFNEYDRFSAVVALQGRVSVEADVNEQTAILQHYLRTLAIDIFGASAFVGSGFEITPTVVNNEITDLEIGTGHCYVDGMLVENPVRPSGAGMGTTFYSQPDAVIDRGSFQLPGDFHYFVYLEVWERLITYVEQPEIRDVALGAGGPDSSARTKTVWQVRVGETLVGAVPNDHDSALAYWPVVEQELVSVNPGTLVASVKPAQDDELCALAPDAGYHGLENQLYRVEIHRGGELAAAGAAPAGDPPTFVWSRDNGSVVFPIADRQQQSNIVKLTTLGRDDRYGLSPGDWVELVDDASVLGGMRADLRRVAQIDPLELLVTLDAAPSDTTGSDPALHPFLRRWDQEPTPNQLGTDNAPVVKAGEIALEDGIEVSFGTGTYRAGDYWVFPARVETGDIEWMPSPGTPRPPDGVRRRYVPLAYVMGSAAGDLVPLRRVVTPPA